MKVTREVSLQRLRHGAALGAGILASASLAFVLLNQPTAHAQAVDAALGYACEFPSGSHPVSVKIHAVFPTSSAVGQPVQPSTASIAVTVPPAARSDLTALGASKASATARLTTTVTQNGTTSQSIWSGLKADPTPVSAHRPTTLDLSGNPPRKDAVAGGSASFSVGALVLDLATTKADGAVTTPASSTISCAPQTGQKTLLATVPVTGSAASATSTSVPCDAMPPPSSDWTAVCTWGTGYANVAKLGSAVVLNDPDFRAPVPISAVWQFTPNTKLKKLDVRFRLQRPLVSQATFLTFRFMPVTAIMELVQEPLPNGDGTVSDWGTMTWEAPGVRKQPPGSKVDIKLMVSIHLSDIRINGAPMDVGTRCATAPTLISLSDVPGYPIVNLIGDPEKFVTGWYDIPAFHGCRSRGGEDLDPLLTGSVSGPKNYLGLTLGSMDPDPNAATFPWPPIR